MVKLYAGLIYNGLPGRSGALRVTPVVLLVLLAALAMAAVAIVAASAAKIAMCALQCALQASTFARIVMGLTLALILSGLLRRLSFRHKLEGLVLFCVKTECQFCLNPCLEAGVQDVVILALAYSSTYL
jgi:hypothetical protein